MHLGAQKITKPRSDPCGIYVFDTYALHTKALLISL